MSKPDLKLLAVMGSFVISYMIVAFLCLEVNPFLWSFDTRFAYVTMVILSMIVSFLLLDKKE